MTQTIESLITTITLDWAGYKKGADDQRAESRKVDIEQDRLTRAVDQYATKQSESFRKIASSALAMFTVFTAGKGLKEFAQGVTNSDAAIGRLSMNLGLSTQTISAWQNIMTRFGGSAADATNTFEMLAAKFQDYRQNGNPEILKFFSTLGVNALDASGKIRPLDALLTDISKNIASGKYDRKYARGMLLGEGIPDAMVNAVLAGPETLQRLLHQQTLMGSVVSPQDAANAQRLINTFEDLKDESTAFGREILNEVSPAVEDLLNWLDKVIMRNRDGWSKEIGRDTKEFVDWIKQVHWDKIGDDFVYVVDHLKDFVNWLGGAERASIALIAVWAGAKALSFLAMLGRIAAAVNIAKIAAGAAGAGTAGAGAAAGAGGVGAAAGAAGAAGATEGAGVAATGAAVGAGEAAAGAEVAGAAAAGGTGILAILGGVALPIIAAIAAAAIGIYLYKHNQNSGEGEKSPPKDFNGMMHKLFPTWGQADLSNSGSQREYGAGELGGGTHPNRDMNPGDIRSGAFAKAHGSIGDDGGFAVFPSVEAGKSAQEELLFGKGSKYLNMTVAAALARYVVNPDAGYVRDAENAAGGNVLLSSMNNQQRQAFLTVQRYHEGFRDVNQPQAGQGYGGTTLHLSIGDVHINAPNATDSKGIAKHVARDIKQYAAASLANTGLQN